MGRLSRSFSAHSTYACCCTAAAQPRIYRESWRERESQSGIRGPAKIQRARARILAGAQLFRDHPLVYLRSMLFRVPAFFAPPIGRSSLCNDPTYYPHPHPPPPHPPPTRVLLPTLARHPELFYERSALDPQAPRAIALLGSRACKLTSIKNALFYYMHLRLPSALAAAREMNNVVCRTLGRARAF